MASATIALENEGKYCALALYISVPNLVKIFGKSLMGNSCPVFLNPHAQVISPIREKSPADEICWGYVLVYAGDGICDL